MRGPLGLPLAAHSLGRIPSAICFHLSESLDTLESRAETNRQTSATSTTSLRSRQSPPSVRQPGKYWMQHWEDITHVLHDPEVTHSVSLECGKPYPSVKSPLLLVYGLSRKYLDEYRKEILHRSQFKNKLRPIIHQGDHGAGHGLGGESGSEW